MGGTGACCCLVLGGGRLRWVGGCCIVSMGVGLCEYYFLGSIVGYGGKCQRGCGKRSR